MLSNGAGARCSWSHSLSSEDLVKQPASRPNSDASIVHLQAGNGRHQRMIEEVSRGLRARLRSIPSKYFYDERGARLFDEITRLPEYYLTRAETAILEHAAPRISGAIRPEELVELGAGYSRKTRLLLDAMTAHAEHARFAPIDVTEEALREAGRALRGAYPRLEYQGFVGDFEADLHRLPRHGRRLVAFLGSTIGNLPPRPRLAFLRSVAACLQPGDGFLVGLDLVKDRGVLERAYNDSRGVTAAFNRNILRVVNAGLDGDFDETLFDHVAFFDERNAWIEMRLRARSAMRVRLAAAGLEFHLEQGEEIRTEVSCKFTRPMFERSLASAGLALLRWETDPAGRFALALARRSDG